MVRFVTEIRTSLVIPCYNEADGIAHLCRRLGVLVAELEADGPVEVLFIDDGSTDETVREIEAEAAGLPFRIVRHASNRGLGAAIKTAIFDARGEEIVTLDSDCTYDPSQVPELLKPLRDGADVVTGSPYHPQARLEGVVGWRLFMSRGLSTLYSLVTPCRLYTYTSCFRAYRAEMARRLEAPDDGFLAVSQLLIDAMHKDMAIVEVPTTLGRRQFGDSKIRVVSLTIAHLRELVRLAARRFLRNRSGRTSPHCSSTRNGVQDDQPPPTTQRCKPHRT